ncbi:hypothetical protein [Mucilaginibacter gossypii]|uniref:Uncharacterized protein n=1 Tax=Mucilaginibacter gossypii TaxID=551996 RepID=A0A1G8D3P2_9SPHI|nr:hypothetical protein [Mucilaginibacter gossypii]SDH52417.1 hypothetical protein SAMN05192573_110117 [Mucilaginibacter gossypii]
MNEELFRLRAQHVEITKRFINNGWIEVYRSGNDSEIEAGIYCCLVSPDNLNKYLEDRDWGIHWGSEGHPSVITHFRDGGKVTEYFRFAEEGLEPFIYPKWFTHVKERYVDVSQEFVNYFKLYEQASSKQKRSYYFIDDSGDTEEVIHVTERQVRIKLKFLNEYLAVRKMHLSLCFDFMIVTDEAGAGSAFIPKDEDFISNSFHYNHLIRVVPGIGDKPLQSWIIGKTMLKFDAAKSGKFWFDLDEDAHESFIIGYDDDGTEKLVRCDSEDYKFFTPVYFKKEVLNKYYDNPQKYEVDGFHIKSSFISLKMDNNNTDYVMVFLNDLTMLPQKEQLHWKHHNIAPQTGMGMSGAYYDTMVLGNWARDSDSVDVRFKAKYHRFNKKWFGKFGWHFYKELTGSDPQHFSALHLPSENNVRAFCEQILILVKATVDSLNEEMLVKGLSKIENEKGIAKLERFLDIRSIQIPDMITFLRNLQDLRSGMMAHRFSKSNKNCQKALTYFGLTEHNYRQVAQDIFIKSLFTLNTFSKLFLDETEEFEG